MVFGADALKRPRLKVNAASGFVLSRRGSPVVIIEGPDSFHIHLWVTFEDLEFWMRKYDAATLSFGFVTWMLTDQLATETGVHPWEVAT
jgi:hypothetical protein